MNFPFLAAPPFFLFSCTKPRPLPTSLFLLLPSSILLPVPRVPTQASRSVHTPSRPSKFFLFIEGRKLAGPSNLETTIFPSLFSSPFFFHLLQNRTDGRAFPPRLSASCAPGSRAPSSIDETATRLEKYPPPPPPPPRPLSRRSRAGGDANRFLVAPVAPCRSNANRSTLRFRHAATFPVPQESSFHRLPSFATTAGT